MNVPAPRDKRKPETIIRELRRVAQTEANENARLREANYRLEQRLSDLFRNIGVHEQLVHALTQATLRFDRVAELFKELQLELGTMREAQKTRNERLEALESKVAELVGAQS